MSDETTRIASSHSRQKSHHHKRRRTKKAKSADLEAIPRVGDLLTKILNEKVRRRHGVVPNAVTNFEAILGRLVIVAASGSDRAVRLVLAYKKFMTVKTPPRIRIVVDSHQCMTYEDDERDEDSQSTAIAG